MGNVRRYKPKKKDLLKLAKYISEKENKKENGKADN